MGEVPLYQYEGAYEPSWALTTSSPLKGPSLKEHLFVFSIILIGRVLCKVTPAIPAWGLSPEDMRRRLGVRILVREKSMYASRVSSSVSVDWSQQFGETGLLKHAGVPRS